MRNSLKKYRKGELAKEILFLVAVGVVIPASLVLPNLPTILKPLLKSLSKKTQAKEQSVVKSILYLKKHRLMAVKERGGEQILILSEEGKRRILKFKLDQISIRRPNKWDGYWRVIAFDIPEKERGGRDALRSTLKRVGFYQLQKSCFVHPFECKDEIDFITETYRISHHVNYMLVSKIEGQNSLKRLFGL